MDGAGIYLFGGWSGWTGGKGGAGGFGEAGGAASPGFGGVAGLSADFGGISTVMGGVTAVTECSSPAAVMRPSDGLAATTGPYSHSASAIPFGKVLLTVKFTGVFAGDDGGFRPST